MNGDPAPPGGVPHLRPVAHMPTDARTHEVCVRIARRCRNVVQACLREEEWGEADREFYRVAREEIERQRPAASDEAFGI
jgi:hypothetical protein